MSTDSDFDRILSMASNIREPLNISKVAGNLWQYLDLSFAFDATNLQEQKTILAQEFVRAQSESPANDQRCDATPPSSSESPSTSASHVDDGATSFSKTYRVLDHLDKGILQHATTLSNLASQWKACCTDTLPDTIPIQSLRIQFLKPNPDCGVGVAQEIPSSAFKVEADLIREIESLWVSHFLPDNVRAEPHNIYLNGACEQFCPCMNAIEEDHIGMFLIDLPDDLEMVDSSTGSLDSRHTVWTAFYTNIHHSRKDIPHGVRSVLSFKIFLKETHSEATEKIKELVKEELSQMPPPFAFGLCYHYPNVIKPRGFERLLLEAANELPHVHIHRLPIISRAMLKQNDDFTFPENNQLFTHILPFDDDHLNIYLQELEIHNYWILHNDGAHDPKEELYREFAPGDEEELQPDSSFRWLRSLKGSLPVESVWSAVEEEEGEQRPDKLLIRWLMSLNSQIPYSHPVPDPGRRWPDEETEEGSDSWYLPSIYLQDAMVVLPERPPEIKPSEKSRGAGQSRKPTKVRLSLRKGLRSYVLERKATHGWRFPPLGLSRRSYAVRSFKGVKSMRKVLRHLISLLEVHLS
ncbi:unnamed protein product [Somion occarium]|uniref:Uncharacterized protein n=1 Tax=Somion occarium TaxID=3059160 RepID=A0ABP1E8C6_9APHY